MNVSQCDITRQQHLEGRPDITLARDKLEWEPKVQLNEGLRRTTEYFDSLLKTVEA